MRDLEKPVERLISDIHETHQAKQKEVKTASLGATDPSDAKQIMAYSHTNNLPKSTAIDQLPNLLAGSRLASQRLGAGRPSVSFPVIGFKSDDNKQVLKNVEEWRDLEEIGAGCQSGNLVRRVGIEPTT